MKFPNDPKPNSELEILLRVIGWLFVTLIFYFFLRMEFIVWNWNAWFHNVPKEDIFWALFQGIRFDLSSITWLSVAVIVGALLPWPLTPLNLKGRVLKTVFLGLHLPFLFFNCLDIEFIHFAGRRMTPDSFYLLSEAPGKFAALWSTYWFLIIFNGILIVWFFQKIQKITFSNLTSSQLPIKLKHWIPRTLYSLIMLIFFTLCARGGFQTKPLEVAHAVAFNADLRITQLVLNSSFTMIHSLEKKRITPVQYFENSEELISLLNAQTPGKSIDVWDRKPKNVVLFILESFGLEYTGLTNSSVDSMKTFDNPLRDQSSFTPFIDSLKNRSLFYPQSFANGRRSIEALPSLLAGIPSLLDEPFITGPFQTNEIPRLGRDLTQKGIWSGFFHGGANGTMFFREFTQRIGMEHYFGKDEYPNPQDDDGTWGIWDGPFLTFFGEKLNEIRKPFFAVFFSLSSHHPFRVPPEYENTLPSGSLPILKTVAYTDRMLAEFFNKYEGAPWFKDTLFIFTADHTSKSYRSEFQNPVGSFRVPFLFYFPGASLNTQVQALDLKDPIQHIDLLPTLQEIFSLEPKAPLLSRSVFKTGPRKVTLYLDGQQILLTKDNQLILPTEGPLPLENQNPLYPAWKAHRQYYINGLIENRL